MFVHFGDRSPGVTDPQSASSSESHPGFVAWPHGSPLLDAIGGFEVHHADDGRFGFVVTEAKVNSRGRLHAGVVASIADVAIGHTLAARMRTSGLPTAFVTVDLSCSYLGSAQLGDWVEGVVTPLKLGRRLAAGAAHFTRRDHPVAAVNALFVPAGTPPDGEAASSTARISDRLVRGG